MKTTHIVAFAWVAMFASACRQDNSDFIDSYCTQVASCCVQAGRPGDGKTCREFMTYTAAGSAYNASAASACLSETKALVAASSCSGRSAYRPWPCSWVYGQAFGTKKPGEKCVAFSDCEPSRDGLVICGGPLGSGVINRCQVLLLGTQGDSPCVGTFDKGGLADDQQNNSTEVVPRAYLCNGATDLTCTDGTCVSVSQAALGTSCRKDSDCVANAYCSDSGYVCAPRVAAGLACKGTNGCVEGAYCDPTSRQCVNKLPNGSSCSDFSVCQSEYCDWKGLCEGNSDFASSILCGG